LHAPDALGRVRARSRPRRAPSRELPHLGRDAAQLRAVSRPAGPTMSATTSGSASYWRWRTRRTRTRPPRRPRRRPARRRSGSGDTRGTWCSGAGIRFSGRVSRRHIADIARDAPGEPSGGQGGTTTGTDRDPHPRAGLQRRAAVELLVLLFGPAVDGEERQGLRVGGIRWSRSGCGARAARMHARGLLAAYRRRSAAR
jgi:hypothetical protein